ncbi:MAG: M28 family peptidase, partial [Candidatus Edwardsbacteria bacterium]|nr:M28 family peptidase [Candidatus Edwardsbacteria bacterium]
MKKLYILAVISVLAIITAEGICSPVLISVELPTAGSNKVWHQLNIPTYELIDNTAIAEVDEGQISLIKQRGYQINIIDQQPDLAKYVIVSNIGRMPELAGNSIWKNDKTAIIKTLPKDALRDRKYKHQIRPFNTKPLGDRFWKSVTTKYVPLKNIPYDPFIQSLVDQVNADSIASYIQRLQDFQTRYLLSDSNYAAAEWIKQKLELWGYLAILDSFYVNDTIQLTDTIFLIGYGRNVIANKPGSLDALKMIFISGHYDSGPTISGSLSLSECPGADDNGSGTASMMEIARMLKDYQTDITVRFIGFDSEENDMRGPKHYAQEVDSAKEELEAIIDMDMIGYQDGLTPNANILYGDNEWLGLLCSEIGQLYMPELTLNIIPESGWSTGPFEDFGYPALTYTEPLNSYPYYHTIQDLLIYLTPQQYDCVTKTALATIAALAVFPSTVSDVTVDQTSDSTSLAVIWSANDEYDVVGYRVWWGMQSGVYTDSTYISGRFATNVIIEGLQSCQKYYITVRAVDEHYHFSLLAQEVIGVPFIYSLNQGVLLVDETNNWTTGSLPSDAQQDSFYNYILSDYKYEQYEYSSTDQKPILADFAQYSTVAWFADDYTTLLAPGAMADIKTYLDNGGKLWFAGWKPTGNIRNNALYPADFTSGDIFFDNFKMSHAELSSTVDSFQTAVGLKGYPDINVDTLKYPSTIWGMTIRSIEALTPTGAGDTIYSIDMKNDGSPFEGKACAVRDSGKTVFFGFPLYFMDKEQVKAAVQKVMAEFGEPYGVTTERPGDSNQKPVLRLYQNAPNPFSKQTTIRYQLPKAGRVSLKIYNVTGQ